MARRARTHTTLWRSGAATGHKWEHLRECSIADAEDVVQEVAVGDPDNTYIICDGPPWWPNANIRHCGASVAVAPAENCFLFGEMQMTARERQVREAEEIARRNPQWEWRDPFLVHASAGDAEQLYARLVLEGSSLGPYVGLLNQRWLAVDRDGVRVRTSDNHLSLFPSPAAAIEALGFTVAEGEQG